MNALKILFWVLLFVAVVLVMVESLQIRESGAIRERRQFIGDNLPFLVAAMNQIDAMHKKYVPEDLSVAEDLSMAREIHATIMEKWPSRDLSLAELDAITDMLSSALQLCSRARAGVMSQLTPEQRHEVETGYKDEEDK